MSNALGFKQLLDIWHELDYLAAKVGYMTTEEKERKEMLCFNCKGQLIETGNTYSDGSKVYVCSDCKITQPGVIDACNEQDCCCACEPQKILI